MAEADQGRLQSQLDEPLRRPLVARWVGREERRRLVEAEDAGPGVHVGQDVPQDQDAVRDARRNLRDTPWARVHRGDAAEMVGRYGLSGASIAVVDPPRAGLSQPLIDAPFQTPLVSVPVALPFEFTSQTRNELLPLMPAPAATWPLALRAWVERSPSATAG